MSPGYLGKMEDQANSRRRPAPEYNVSNMVMLDARNIKKRQYSKGLSPNSLGPR